jgi:multiple sugar transport system ATP-binding protein
MASLQLVGVTKTYAGGVQAVMDVNLEVRSGELLVLFGPSGSGKTTLLRLIAGLEQPTAGKVLIDGVDQTSVTPHRRNLAMVFQSGGLYGHLTVDQNLRFGLTGQSAETDERVKQVVERLGIAAWLARRPAELSGGQQQRVALAKALVRRPRALLLDEPLASLDGPVRLELAQELSRQLRREGLTTIHVTHDLAEGLALADRIGVLVGGRLRQVGEPREVFDQPADADVAALFAPLRATGTSGWWWQLTGERAI